MPTLGAGAAVVLILHLFRYLVRIRTTTTPTSHIPMMPTDVLKPIRLPVCSHRLTIECARPTIANDSPASRSLISSGQHAAHFATRKALPHTHRLVMHRRARAPRKDVSADSTLTPSLVGILLVSASAVSDASTQPVRGTLRPVIEHSSRDMAQHRPPRARTSLPVRPQF